MELPQKPFYNYSTQDPRLHDPRQQGVWCARERERVRRQTVEARRQAVLQRSALELELEDHENCKDTFVSAAKVVAMVSFSLLATVGYSFLGAVVFMNLERPNEKESCKATEKIYHTAEENTVKSMLMISQSYGAADAEDQLEELAILRQMLIGFRDDVILTLYYDGRNCSMLGEEGGPDYDWSLIESLLFCVSTITTIGYGNVVPKTSWGRMTCISYAMFGVPIVFLSLTAVGEIMASVFRFTYSHICCLESCKKSKKEKPPLVSLYPGHRPCRIVDDYDDDDDDDDDDEDEEIPVPISITILVIACYIIMGTIMFCNWEEDWGYLEAGYYCFITIATVGFGDVLPSIGSDEDSVLKIVVASAYIFLGLALMAMGFDLIEYEMARRFVSIGGQNMGRAGDTVDEIFGKSVKEVQRDVSEGFEYGNRQRLQAHPDVPRVKFPAISGGDKSGVSRKTDPSIANFGKLLENFNAIEGGKQAPAKPAWNSEVRKPMDSNVRERRNLAQYNNEFLGDKIQKRSVRDDPSIEKKEETDMVSKPSEPIANSKKEPTREDGKETSKQEPKSSDSTSEKKKVEKNDQLSDTASSGDLEKKISRKPIESISSESENSKQYNNESLGHQVQKRSVRSDPSIPKKNDTGKDSKPLGIKTDAAEKSADAAEKSVKSADTSEKSDKSADLAEKSDQSADKAEA